MATRPRASSDAHERKPSQSRKSVRWLPGLFGNATKSQSDSPTPGLQHPVQDVNVDANGIPTSRPTARRASTAPMPRGARTTGSTEVRPSRPRALTAPDLSSLPGTNEKFRLTPYIPPARPRPSFYEELGVGEEVPFDQPNQHWAGKVPPFPTSFNILPRREPGDITPETPLYIAYYLYGRGGKKRVHSAVPRPYLPVIFKALINHPGVEGVMDRDGTLKTINNFKSSVVRVYYEEEKRKSAWKVIKAPHRLVLLDLRTGTYIKEQNRWIDEACYATAAEAYERRRMKEKEGKAKEEEKESVKGKEKGE